MKTIDQNKKYKEKQRIEKSKKKLEEKLQKRLESEKLKYDALKANNIAKITSRYDKKLELRLKKIAREYDRKRINEKKKIQGKEVKKKEPKNMKSKALAEIQKYAKLSRAYLDWDKIMIYLYDKKITVELDKKVNWWHCYPQRNYPQLAFEVNNIRPISARWNKTQADNIAFWKINLPRAVEITLDEIAKKKILKNQIMDHRFYQDIIDKYKKLNAVEKERLGLNK